MNEKNDLSVKKIAELTGVSPSTVSMVLNNRGEEFHIAEKTRERILQTATGLGYQHVIRPKRKKKKSVPDSMFIFCHSYFGKGQTGVLYNGFLRYLKDKNLSYDVVLFPYETGKLAGKSRWLSSECISAALLLGMGQSDIDFIENNRFDVPIILFNRSAKGYSSIMTDDYSVGYRAMSHFIKRERKVFAAISSDNVSRGLSLRLAGYWDRFNSYSIKSGEAVAVPVAYGEDSDAGGSRAMQVLLETSPVPDAVFIQSDNMVGGIVRKIHESGLRIPEDIELISYGNGAVNRNVTPSVSSFAAPMEEMGYQSSRLLHRLLLNGINSENVKLSFEAECIFRESSPAPV